MTVLVIDIGSSSVRAMLFDESLRLLPDAMAVQSHRFTTDQHGRATANAENLRHLVERCVDEVMQHPAAQSILVVGMAAFVGNLLGVAVDGGAVTPVFTYADSRSHDDVQALRDQINVSQMHQETGCLHHSAYHPGKLHWLRRMQPEVFHKVVQWIDFGTYLYRHWFADAVPASYSVTSWSGMFDRARCDWHEGWLDVLAIDHEVFPELQDYDFLQRGLTTAYHQRWPALADVPFCLAVGDGAAANIGSGAVDAKALALTVGTTAALRQVIPAQALPPVPAGLWCYRVDVDHHLSGGASSEGGNIFSWARDTLKLNLDAVEARLQSRKPDGHGLTFLPLLAGERSPGWSEDASGTIAGIRLSTTPLDILQAALEGVALRLSMIAELLDLPEDVRIMGSGGALTASPAWAQIIANALNRPLHLIENTESTARGTAIMALAAVGQGNLDSYPPVISLIVEPQPDAAWLLRSARDRQIDLYRRMGFGAGLA